jgi:MraZ protein
VDEQRRIAIPRAWRRGEAPPGLFLLPGRNRSISVIPERSFEDLVGKLRKVSFADAQAARALAQIGSIAQECRCDKQGRITITQELLDHAKIAGKALLLGSVTFIQMYSPEEWAQQAMSPDVCLDVIQRIQEQPDDLTNILRTVPRN